jgi:hypothetical protein
LYYLCFAMIIFSVLLNLSILSNLNNSCSTFSSHVSIHSHISSSFSTSRVIFNNANSIDISSVFYFISFNSSKFFTVLVTFVECWILLYSTISTHFDNQMTFALSLAKAVLAAICWFFLSCLLACLLAKNIISFHSQDY